MRVISERKFKKLPKQKFKKFVAYEFMACDRH